MGRTDEEEQKSIAKQARLRDIKNPDRNRHVRWTMKDHTTVKRMANEGHDFEAIGYKLGRTEESIKSHHYDYIDPNGRGKQFGGWLRERRS